MVFFLLTKNEGISRCMGCFFRGANIFIFLNKLQRRKQNILKQMIVWTENNLFTASIFNNKPLWLYKSDLVYNNIYHN